MSSTTTSTPPTVVLVPGGWQGPEAYELLTPELEAAGFPQITISLPSIGVRPGLPDFSADVKAVRAAVVPLVEQGKEVVVLGHSYGAVPMTEALHGLGQQERGAAGLNGGVIRLVYVAAIVPQLGESTRDVLVRLRKKNGIVKEGGPGIQNGVRWILLRRGHC